MNVGRTPESAMPILLSAAERDPDPDVDLASPASVHPDA